ncbi:BrnA antitoxin family protein [Treponema putidum]|uniref:Cytoplasmic protein n=1 Tax=Treponema putidum TaxID=221027 RepID=A0ABY5HTV6_9SPIR|nr:BrnA antitoxin family protein [Treponema putidum]UTY28857.1 cytoplasmic protein [Treponema putidum]
MKKLNISQIMAECERNAIPDELIDTSEIPEINSLDGFDFGNEKYFKPVKEQVSIRFNKVLLDHFRSKGRRWQSEVNDFLMKAYKNGQI